LRGAKLANAKFGKLPIRDAQGKETGQHRATNFTKAVLEGADLAGTDAAAALDLKASAVADRRPDPTDEIE
jgi:uncharacterized protein YjbI with pentapeptide repeats